MKKLLVLIIALFALSSFSFANDLSMGGNIGMEEIGGIMYYSLALNPEARFGKMGIGLDLYLRWNDEGLFPYTTDDLLSMIKYVSWGDKGVKPVYARFGILEDSLLGHGFILNHYQNATPFTIEKGLKRLGAQLDVDFKYVGFESITNDVSSFKVRGGRAFVRPLAPFIKKGPLSGLAVGVSYLEDIDPYESQRAIILDRKEEENQLTRYEYYIDIYEQNGVEIDNAIKQELFDISLIDDMELRWTAFHDYSTDTATSYLIDELFEETEDLKKRLAGYSIDAELPVLGNFVVLITDFARQEGYDKKSKERFTTELAHLYGVKGALNLGQVRLQYQVDYRNIPEDYIPAIFNSQYEFVKPIILQKIEDPKRISGYFGDVNIFILNNVLRVNLAYEDYVDTAYPEIFPRINGELELNPNLTKNLIGYGVGAQFTLEKLDAETLDFNDIENTTIKGNVTIDVAKSTQVVYEYFRSWDSFGTEVKQVKLYTQIKF